MRIKTVNITDEVAGVLRRAEWDGPVLMLRDPAMERTLYAATDKVLRALGGKWNRQLRGHVFPSDMRAQMEAALEAGGVVDQKKTFEQFFTPADVANHMADLLGIADGMHVLEPSAGSGRLVSAAIGRGGSVTAVEIDPALIPAIICEGDIRYGWLRVCEADFMKWTPADALPGEVCYFPDEIDAVIMNPPFSGGQDMAHVRRAFEFLRPGGKLVSVMSPHWVFATDRAANDFRVFLSRLGDAAYDWLPLPDGTFKESGTSVSTGLLFITKPE